MTDSSDRNTDPPMKQIDRMGYLNVLMGEWISTRNEVDRQLISTSGIGILVLMTILCIRGAKVGLEQFFFSLAILGFIITMVSMVVVFHLNSHHLKSVIDKLIEAKCEDIETSVEDTYMHLMPFDYIGLAGFTVALISCVCIGVLAMYSGAV